MKKSTIKKLIVAMLTFVMVFAMAACGGGGGSSDSGSSSDGITIFNSKMEIQDQFEELAEQYTEETGVPVEVYYSQDTVAAHLATKYASKDPYTVNMVDAKDIYSLAKEYGADMSSEAWVGDTDYSISVDDKVLGFPVCIEARGVIFNSEGIKAALGEDFDYTTIKTRDDFKALLDKLVQAGMDSPTAIMKEDWSLAAHYLAQVYEEREDPEAFVQDLYAGNVDLMKDSKFNELMDTFDVLKEYSKDKASPIAAERDLSEQALAEGTIAFMFGGNWDFAEMKKHDYVGGAGMMSVPQNAEDAYTGKLVGGGSKYFYVDASEYTSEEKQQQGKDFLNWLVSSDAGKTFISDTCGMVSPFKSNDVECSDDLGKAVKKFADAGMLVPNYNYLPDDHYSVLGAEMQKYLANQCSRQELATAIQDYWKNVTPVEH